MRVLGAEVLSWKERLCLRRRGSVLEGEVLSWEQRFCFGRWIEPSLDGWWKGAGTAWTFDLTYGTRARPRRHPCRRG